MQKMMKNKQALKFTSGCKTIQSTSLDLVDQGETVHFMTVRGPCCELGSYDENSAFVRRARGKEQRERWEGAGPSHLGDLEGLAGFTVSS